MININYVIDDVMLLHKIEHYQYRASGLAIVIGKISLIDYYGAKCILREVQGLFRAWGYFTSRLCILRLTSLLFGLYHV